MPLRALLMPFGTDLFCTGKKFLVFNLVSRNIKIKYRRSIAGLFWTILTPLAMAMIYYFVFKVILRVNLPHYLVFILSGVLPWAFFSQTLLEGMESIVGNWGLVSKVPVPLQVFPLVGTLTNLVTLFLAFPIVFAAGVIGGSPLGLSIFAILPYCLILFLLTYSIALIMAVGFVFFRDLRHLMGLFMQLWFYATPVIYDESMIPAKYRWILFVNPVGHVFTALHHIFTQGVWPTPVELGTTSAWTLFVLGIALWVQRNVCVGLVERI